ncbi:MAG: Trehalose synthase [Acetothermia bacterium 64_32]|nr:MAG: Trehalose synthase [Acetothermia bacterium 64_32]HAF70520.1 glycosyl transferase family 1 [Candidatus Acetothermia bacterium]
MEVTMEAIGIEKYVKCAGEKAVAQIQQAARPLLGLHVLHVNSTFHGGGVAGMLHSLVPLMNDVGINADWNLLYGDPALFEVTKKLHNALQGEEVEICPREWETYLAVNETFSRYSPIFHDVVVVHDPQPLPMIRYRQKEGPWVWRCHIDISSPFEPVWDVLKLFILRYDTTVVSTEGFRRADLPVHAHVIAPAIDPFSEINRELSQKELEGKLAEHGISSKKPLIVQVSRFDKWKDPLGVLEVFRKVKEEVDCQLVLMGNMAADDPEGARMFEQVFSKAQELTDVKLIAQTDALLVNALQRVASVVLQLSLREGFALTVSEALWKGTPVVATDVGGIPLQVLEGKTGFLVAPRDYDGAAERVVQILKDPDLGRELGEAGRKHVREHFLITRLLLDWLRLLAEVV